MGSSRTLSIIYISGGELDRATLVVALPMGRKCPKVSVRNDRFQFGYGQLLASSRTELTYALLSPAPIMLLAFCGAERLGPADNNA